jgi:hypothetical protein
LNVSHLEIGVAADGRVCPTFRGVEHMVFTKQICIPKIIKCAAVIELVVAESGTALAALRIPHEITHGSTE